jgi:signal peptidase II
MPLHRNRLLALALCAVVAADWASKFLVQNHLRLNARVAVIEGWLWLAHARNIGVAFSFLQDVPPLLRLPLLGATALLGIAVAGRIALASADGRVRLAGGLVVAGAVGNLGDRLLNGGVTDFILVRWFPFVFNLADVAITLGALLLITRLVSAEPPLAGPAAPAQS